MPILDTLFGNKKPSSQTETPTVVNPLSFVSNAFQQMKKTPMAPAVKKEAPKIPNFQEKYIESTPVEERQTNSEILASLARLTTRAPVNIVTSLAPLERQREIAQQTPAEFQGSTSKASSKLATFLFGEEPFSPLGLRVTEQTEKAQQAGISPYLAAPTLAIGALGEEALNVFFGQGSKVKATAKTIGALSDANEIRQALKTTKIADDIVAKYTDDLVRADAKEAERILYKMKDEQSALVKAQETATKAPPKPIEGVPPKDVSDAKTTDQIYYNLDRMDISDEAKVKVRKEIENFKETIHQVVGKPLTNKEVIELADDMEEILTTAVSREDTAAKIAATLNLRRELARVAETGRVDDEFMHALLVDKSAGTDIARQLQARKITAEGDKAVALREYLKNIEKTGADMEKVLEEAKKYDLRDPNQAAEFYRKFVKPKTEEWLDAVRYNSMLSSPLTHIKNIFSNVVGGGIVNPATKAITGGVDFIRAALGGGPRKYFVGEAGAYAQKFYSGTALRKAMNNFADVMKGRVAIEQADIRNIALATKGPKKKIEQILRIPTKMLEAFDKFFIALVESGEKAALETKALRQGRKIDPIEIYKEARARADKTLFRSELIDKNEGILLDSFGRVAGLVELARKSPNWVVRNTAKLSVPFIRTATNIIKTGLEYNPLTAPFTLFGAKNKEEQIAKAIFGTMVGAGMATLVGADRLTFSEPRDPAQKAQFRAEGRQPYSVRIGDKWVSYQYMHPAFSFPMAMMASVDQALKEKRIDDSTADVILTAFAKNSSFIYDQSFLRNIGDLVDSFKGDPEGPARLMSNYTTQFVPFRATLGWIERLLDPVQRLPDAKGTIEKQMQYIMTQIPGLAQMVPARTTPEGTPVKNQNRLLNAFSPVKVTEESPESRAQYQMLEEARKLRGESQIQSSKINKDVETLARKLRNTSSSEDRKRMALEFVRANPGTEEKLKDAYLKTAYNITATDKAILSLGVSNGDRADFIAKQVKKLPTVAARKKYVKELVEKKIVTGDVAAQLLPLIRNDLK